MFELGQYYEFRMMVPGDGLTIESFVACILDISMPLVTIQTRDDHVARIVNTTSQAFISATMVKAAKVKHPDEWFAEPSELAELAELAEASKLP